MLNHELIIMARMVSLREELDTFENKALLTLQKQYKAANKTLLSLLSKTLDLDDRDRINSVLQEINAVEKAIAATISNEAADYIAESGAYSYVKTNDIVGWDGRVRGFNNVALSTAQMKQLITEQQLEGKVLSEWIGDALAPDLALIKEAISTSVIAGTGYPTAVSALRVALGLEVGSKNARDLESVFKTYVQSVMVSAQQQIYAANKDVVKQVEWTAIMEPGNTKTGKGTCPRCIALDGQRWVTTNYNRPPCPLHTRCRCMLYPVTKTWKDLGFDIEEMEDAYQPWTVRDKNGRIIEHGLENSYADWFGTRSNAFQDNAIGPKRAELYRQGKLKLSELVDKKGALITLDKLSANA